jgi:hypothetical protein
MAVPTNVHPDLSKILDAMNNSIHAFFYRSLCEVLQDQDDAMERLALARQAMILVQKHCIKIFVRN